MKKIITALYLFWVIIFSVGSGLVGANGVKYTAGTLRDPMEIPPDLRIKESEQKSENKENKKETALPSMSIAGVVWGGKTPMAIINNKVAKIGDIIGKAQVVNISKEGVLFLYEGKEFMVKTEKSLIKTNMEVKSE